MPTTRSAARRDTMDIFGAEFDPSRPSMQGLPFLSPGTNLLFAPTEEVAKPQPRRSRRTTVLKKAEAGEVDKQKFPAIGLKVKKANAASGAWTPAVQAKFVAVVQAEPA